MREFPKVYTRINDMVLEAISKTMLDPFDVNFEVVSYEEMNSIASYVGFPVRYPHWRFGMDYERHQKMNRYGLQKIYELVINNDPAYAYLLEGSDLSTIKTVMAHVYAHSDFFKNNYAFRNTNRRMLDKMGTNASIIRKIINEKGIEAVESFIDSCLMIEDLIDSDYPFRPKKGRVVEPYFEEEGAMEIPKLKSKDYMQDFINPPEFIEQQKKRLEREKELKKEKVPGPERDVMRFLLENAPLEKWEEKILSIILEESYYFLPQRQTKIMNEGWASFWHSRLMTSFLLRDENLLENNELFNYADNNSKILYSSPTQLNPYKLGVELFKYIEHCWDTGRHGWDYDNCDGMARKESWNTCEGKGLEQIFLVRECYNDLMFIDEFFTPDFVKEQKYYVYDRDKDNNSVVIVSKEFKDIKSQLLSRLTNLGQPLIYVVNSNFKNRGELQLYHKWTGSELKRDFAMTTLKSIARIWKRPVCIETREKAIDKINRIRIVSDGEKVELQKGTSMRFF